MITELALWAALVIFGLLTLSGYARVARTRGFRERGRWHAPLLFTSAALALSAALAVTASAAAGLAVLAVLPLVLITALVYRAWEATAQVNGKGAATRLVLARLWRCVRHELRGARDDLRALTRRRGGEEPQQAPPRAASAPPAAAGTSGGPAPRAVPPVIREDEALAPVPHPAEVATGLAEAGVEVPAPYQGYIDWIAQQDPETDDDQSLFLHGVAAGKIAEAEAWQVHGENMVAVVGLDPSYGAAILDLADSCAEHASDAVLVDRRYHVIYGEIKRAVANGLHIPHKARQWFGGGGPAPQDGPSESAA